MGRAVFLLWLAVGVLPAADDLKLTLARQAQSVFDRAATADPRLADASQCVQAQAALAAVADRDELPLVTFRKGYCALIEAVLTHRPTAFQNAATAFDQSSAAWPARTAKGKAPEAAPPVLRALSAMAQLAATGQDGPETEDIAVAAASGSCSSELMSFAECQAVYRSGYAWLGWTALRRGDLREAARAFIFAPDSPWAEWTAGRQAFSDGRYGDAAARYAAAIDRWKAAPGHAPAHWMTRVAPQPEMAAALADLGGARLLAGDAAAALATLDAAVRSDPQRAGGYYLRAQAKERAGQLEAAFADYNLAVRTALAAGTDQASGEAHFYRGILNYRRKEVQRAEDEFTGALNAEVPAALRADAIAWRHMAAVASGACGTSRSLLAEALASVSPYFPKPEAKSLIEGCATGGRP